MQPQGQTLTITLNPDQSVAISGPIGNKMIAYAMLEFAKDAIREYVDKNNQGKPGLVVTQTIPAPHNGKEIR